LVVDSGAPFQTTSQLLRAPQGLAPNIVNAEAKAKPGPAGSEGADLVEGRCLEGHGRLERRIVKALEISRYQPIHGLPGAQASRGRGLRCGVEPQATRGVLRIFEGEREAKLIALACHSKRSAKTMIAFVVPHRRQSESSKPLNMIEPSD
jgi:hypothetical protein